MNQWTSQNVTFGQAFAETIASAWKTAPMNPLINTAKVRLSSDPAFNPTPASTVTGLAANEASFSGYTSGGVAAVVSNPVVPDPSVIGALVPALFEAATATPFVPGTVYGWWIDDGTNVIAAEAFPGGQSANFGAVGDFLSLLIILPVQLQQATG